MSDTLAALEFDRVLRLVASFARSEHGRNAVLTTLPRFDTAGGSSAFRLAREVESLVARTGPLAFSALDEAVLLDGSQSGSADQADLARLISFVRGVVETRAALANVVLGPELARLAAALPHLDAFLAYCEQRIGPEGEILDSASPALAQARAGRERHRQAIVARLDLVRRRHPQLAAPYTIRRERYCLPVPAGERATLPGLLLDVSSSGASVFVEPFEVVELNNALAEATALAAEEERRILAELAAAFARRRDELRDAADRLAELDGAQARILFGKECQATLIEPGAAGVFRLRAARHPLLDPSLAALRDAVFGAAGNTGPVVPLDFAFPEDTKLLLLSGPNAGGKTVALKTVGLAALMAQTGIPVLAEPGSALPPLSGVWCHIGDEQNLLSDLSTFTGAMRATATLLGHAGPAWLVLYDELGSGTDPEEGAALAAALLEELVRTGCWTVATAHLVTVAAHVEQLPGAANAAMGYDEASGRPTYRFQSGLPGRSRGLAIAATCGVAPRVVARARSLLSRAYLALDTYLARLDDERAHQEREAARLAELQLETTEARHRFDRERERLASERAALGERLAEERDRLRRVAREKLDAAFAALDAARASGEIPGKRRRATLHSAALDLGDDEPAPATLPPLLDTGARVRVRGLGAIGLVGRLVGDRVEVQLAGKRLWVEAAACELVEATPPPARTIATVASGSDSVAGELKLLGLTEEEAREQLEHFLDRALMAGQRRIRIVHGHGSGVLKRMVREVLAHHPAVTVFVHPPQHLGGTGVTEAELES